MSRQNVDVAAYIWPSYTGKEPRSRMFWPQGIGEWETVREAKPKFEGHAWPRVPLLGYQDEADPVVMEQQIALARSYGVNVFIYDWYWYDGRPFLEQCLDEGFLKAANNAQMQFYLMWANHDANYLWDRRLSSTELRSTVVWQGKTVPSDFRVIGERWLTQYFTRSNYYKMDGKPVIAIYDLSNFIQTFGSVAQTREAMQWLDGRAREYGLAGIHYQLIHQGGATENLMGISGLSCAETLIRELPFSSLTNYQFAHMTDVNRTLNEVMPDVVSEWNRLNESFDIPYFPHVSIGWDNNPRHPDLFKPKILRDNRPQEFEKAMRQAKRFAEQNGRTLITVNSWNEWTEGSYLLPDDVNGYGYLEAIRRAVLEETETASAE